MEIILFIFAIPCVLFLRHLLYSGFQPQKNSSSSKNEYKSIAEQYLKLAPIYLGKTGQADVRILRKVRINIANGHSAEECIVISYLYEAALLVDELYGNIESLVALIPEVSNFLKTLKTWKDNNRISVPFWENMSTLIYKVTFINDPEHSKALNTVLKQINADIENKSDSKEYINLAIEMASTLKKQFSMISDKKCDVFSFGYIIGFCDWYIQDKNRYTSNQSLQEVSSVELATVAIVFMQIYGHEKGSEFLGVILKELENNNPLALNGKTMGTSDYLRFNKEGIEPISLVNYYK